MNYYDADLEEVVLMHHAAVGQVAMQTFSQGSFTPVSYPDNRGTTTTTRLINTNTR